MPGNDSFSLFSSVKSARELLQRSIADGAPQPQRELEAGLHAIDARWEKLRTCSDELATERQRYSEFFEYAPDAYLFTDSGGTIREANRAAAELTGVALRALDGKPLASYVPEDSRPDFRARVVRASAQPDGEVSVWRGALRGREGKPVQACFRVRAMPVADGGLAPLCWLIRLLD